MNKFVKQVLNSVAVQAAVYAVTEGSKVAWPKAKEAFNKVVNKVETVATLQKNGKDFKEVIKNTEANLLDRQAAARQKKAAKNPPDKVDAGFNSES